MSRTYKDKPAKLLWGDYAQDYIYLANFRHIMRKTTKPKLRRSVDTDWQWYNSTPSWWNSLFHTKPKRGKFRNFSKLAVKSSIESLDDMLEPSDCNKPHKYYY